MTVSAQPQNVPSNRDFATEVRTERLVMLWRVTLVVALFLSWLVISVAMVQRIDVVVWVVALGVLMIACLLTRSSLRRDHFNAGAWLYAGGWLVTISLLLASRDLNVIQIVPFVFPLIIFVIGLLLPPSNTFTVVIIAVLATVGIPWTTTGSLAFFDLHQVAALVLTVLAALLAAQVTGELYQVTEWALLNYQRERRTSSELFESRELLERSLVRTQALSERLQEANAELQKARTAAEEAKHYRGQFLANMSHELRTPLNAIIGFSETMLKFPAMYDDVGLPDAYEADLQQIHNSGRQLLGLINDILDLSKVDAGKLEIRMTRVDLKPIIADVISTAQGLIANKSIELRSDLPETIPPIWADDARVRQVLLNLYSNAAKFTDNGSITIRARAEAEGIHITVTDTGHGIAQENLETIFEEFKQGDGSGRRDPRAGAGLGLTISRQLLTLMGGRIWAESEIGKGSTFHFIVQPYVEEKTLEITQKLVTSEIKASTLDEKERIIREPEREEIR